MKHELANLISTATQAAYLSGIETLSKEQFDALFLAMRGIGAIKNQHAKDNIGLESALIQEDILKLIGIPLNENYLEEKEKLLDIKKRIYSHSSAQEIEKTQSLYQKKITALRKKYRIDEYIHQQINDLIKNPQAYESIKNNFSTHLSMSFIDEDFDVKEKQAYESDAEFKIKQDLNKKNKEYNKLKSNFNTDIDLINIQFDEAIKSQYNPIQNEIDKIEEEINNTRLNSKKHIENLITFYPGEQVRDLDISNLDSLKKEIQNKPKNANDFSKIAIEIEVLDLVVDNLDKLNLMDPEKRMDAILDIATSKINTQESENIASYNQKIDAIIETVKPKIDELKQEKKEAVQQCRKKHETSISEANNFHDKEILPLIKALKTQEAHKYFVVLSKKMSSFIQDNLNELSTLDANSIAFISLMDQYNSDLSILGGVHHVAMKIANDAVADVITNNIEDNGNLNKNSATKLVNKTLEAFSKKLGTALGKELAQIESSKKSFSNQIEFMEKISHIRIPDIVEDEFEHQTFMDFYTPVDSSVSDESAPKSVFDFVQNFNKNKGVLGKANVAYDVYKALTAETSNLAFIDAPNTPQLFLRALEDESLGYHYQMLCEVEHAIDILEKNSFLDNTKNRSSWINFKEKIIELNREKDKLDSEFRALCDNHITLREQFLDAQEPLNSAKKSLSKIKEEKQKNYAIIQKLRHNRKEEEAKLCQKHLPPKKQSSILKSLEKLDNEKKGKIDSLEKSVKHKASQYSERHLKTLKTVNEKFLSELKKYDKETDQVVLEYTKNQFEAENGFFSALTVKDNELKQFLEKNTALQEKISKYTEQRQQGKTKIIQLNNVNIDKLNQDHRHKIANLDERKKTHIYQLEKEFSIQREKILKPFKTIEEELSKIDMKISELEKRIESNEHEISERIKQVNANENKLKEISREFYKKTHGFKEKKSNFHLATQATMDTFFTLDPHGEPHLSAMKNMFKSAHLKTKVLAKLTKYLPTVVDEASLHAMSYDEVINRTLERREIKAVTKTSEERDLLEKVKENVTQIGAQSVVEAISGQSVKVFKNMVATLDATLEAERNFNKQQMIVNERAQEKAQALGIDLASLTTTPQTVALTETQSGFFSRLWHRISDFFSRLTKSNVGTAEEQQENKTVLNSFIAQNESTDAESLIPLQEAYTKEKTKKQKQKLFASYHNRKTPLQPESSDVSPDNVSKPKRLSNQ